MGGNEALLARLRERERKRLTPESQASGGRLVATDVPSPQITLPSQPKQGGVSRLVSRAGSILGEVDKPLSQRLGLRIPDMPGPVDEALNVGLEELTRPSTLAIAAGGSGLALKAGSAARLAKAAGAPASRLARAGQIAGSVIAPAGGTTFGSKLAAEAAISAGARAGSSVIQDTLPENTPTAARVLVGLVAGVAGGAAALGATRAGVRSAVGRDILAPDLGAGKDLLKPRVTSNIPDITARKGKLLRLPTADAIKSPKDVQQFVHTTRSQVSSAVQTVVARVDHAGAQLGIKPGTTEDVVLAGVTDAAGNPAKLGAVLEFPNRFTMSPAKRKAIDELRAVRDDVANESALYGRPVEQTGLDPDQEYWPRAIIEDETRKRGARGVRFVQEKERLHRTYESGAAAGVRYQNPLESMKNYATRQIENAAAANAEDVFKTAKALDAVEQAALLNPALVETFKKMTQEVRGKRATLIRQNARAGVWGRVAGERGRAAVGGMERVSASDARSQARNAVALTPQEMAEVRAETSSLITEGRELAVRTRLSMDEARKLGRLSAKNEQAVTRELDNLEAQMRAVEDVNKTVGDIERTFDQPMEIPNDPIYRQAIRETASADRTARIIQRRIDRLGEYQAKLEDRLDTAILKGETLKEMDTVSRVILVESRRAERQMAHLDKLAAKSEVELKQLEREQSRLTRAAADAANLTAAQRAKAAASAKQYDSMRDSVRDMRDQLKWQRTAIQNRPDRAVLPQDIAPGLRGYDFPTDVADRIAKVYREGELPRDPQLGNVVRGYKEIIRNTTALTAIGDASSLGNQLALFAISHPLVFTKNMAAATRDAFLPQFYDRYLAQHAQDAAAHGLAVFGRQGTPNEFTFSSWIADLPFFKQSQKFFEASTTRNRVDLFNQFVDIAERQGEPLSDLAKEQVARSLNRFSGVSNTKAGQVETLTEFAANYMRSSIETITSAVADGSLEGSLARQYLRNLVALGQLTVAAAAAGAIPGAEKRPMEEVLNPLDLNALKRGEVKMNPNFGTIRMFGQDVSVYGRFDSLARLATVSADAVTRAISERDAMELFDAIGYAAGTKGNVPIRILSDAAKGHTFAGDSPLSLKGLFLASVPFSASSFIQDLREGEPVGTAAVGGAVSFIGGKANPLTVSERLNNLSRTVYGRELDDITPKERQQLDLVAPNLARAYQKNIEKRAETGDVSARTKIENQKVDADRLEAERQLNLDYRAQTISGTQFRDAVELLQATAAAKKEGVEAALKPDRGIPTGADAALSEWYDLYRKAEVSPGVINWDQRDKLEQQLFQRVAAGEFGDPAKARAQIEDRKRTDHPDLKWYFDAKQVISDSGYYETADTRFAPFQQIASRVAGRPVESYSDLQRLAEAPTARRLKSILNRVDTVVDRDRRRMRLQSPALDDALERARGLTLIRQQRR